jgi:hypothetical protein
MAGSAGSVRVDAEDYARVRLQAREFSQELDKELAKALRKAGKIGADAAKAKIRTMPTHGYISQIGQQLGQAHHGVQHVRGRSRGLRNVIAANIRVQASGKDVRIIQGTTGISGHNARGLPRRIDEGGTFRHPVFGRDVWVSQAGYPYFKQPIASQRPAMEHEVADALDRALAVMERRT